MKRINYIYSIVPLYAVLGFVRSLEAWFGPLWALVTGSLVCLAVWALVWLRLYSGGKLRPELAVLSVLPVFCYLGLKFAGEEALEAVSAPGWQNVFFMTWCFSVLILILSVRRTPAELKEQGDGKRGAGVTFIISAFFIIIAFLTWVGTAADLYLHL